MCRMLAVASKDPFPIRRWLVEASPGLLGLSLQGKNAPHRDGLGFAFRDLLGQWKLFRFGPKALSLGGIPGPLDAQARLLLAHARKASPDFQHFSGGLYAHPFFYDGIFLCHNGTVCDVHKLGFSWGTDSQQLTFWFARNWHPRCPERFEELATELLQLLQDYSALNLLLSDGERIYVLCAYTRDPDYFTLWFHAGEDFLAVASEPADLTRSWVPLENHEILVIFPSGTFERRRLC